MRRSLAATVLVVSAAATAFAGGIAVSTGASATATYGDFSQTAGPFPWSDLGITAGASVTGGVLNVGTGGSTNYTLNTAVSGSESFVPGSTVLQLGYTPGWTGSFSGSPSATGSLNSQFVYNIGPISGSTNLLNVPLFSPAAGGDLSASLNAGFGIPVISSETASGLGISAGITLSAQAFCPFCVTVASVSLGFNVGTEISQTVSATPVVTYGDLIWYSKTQTYSPSDTFTFVSGAAGDVNNTFSAPPSSLGLANGDTFYMNILPEVELDMPVLNLASVTVPASITASWDVFGAGGSANYPLGNLYSLSNGGQSFDFDPTFYGNFFYSVPLQYSEFCGTACFVGYRTPAAGGSDTDSGGIPIDIPPTINITGGGATPGGYGSPNMGPLFPGDPSPNPICGANGGECINQVTQTGPTPEPDSVALLALGLLGLSALRLGQLRRK